MRWAIVRELRAGTRCACELSDVAEVSPPLLSHHLKVLREASLVDGTKRGRWVDYTLNTDALAELFARAEPESFRAMTTSELDSGPALSAPRRRLPISS